MANVEFVEGNSSCLLTDLWNVTAGMKQVCIVCKILCDATCMSDFIHIRI